MPILQGYKKVYFVSDLQYFWLKDNFSYLSFWHYFLGLHVLLIASTWQKYLYWLHKASESSCFFFFFKENNLVILGSLPSLTRKVTCFSGALRGWISCVWFLFHVPVWAKVDSIWLLQWTRSSQCFPGSSFIFSALPLSRQGYYKICRVLISNIIFPFT